MASPFSPQDTDKSQVSIATVVIDGVPSRQLALMVGLEKLAAGVARLTLIGTVGLGLLACSLFLEELGRVLSKVPDAASASISLFCLFLPPVSWGILHIGLVGI